MFTKTVVALALVAIAASAPSQPAYGYAPQSTYEVPAKYDFNYAVKDDYSGNDFGHQEARDGYDTQGSYYVLLSDGRCRRSPTLSTVTPVTWPRSATRVRPSTLSTSLPTTLYLPTNQNLHTPK
ncbi:pupal cuticle protein Edg-84A-like [Penaeus monodon]|uniref:pupal cuticle protein Edg-84A-like n=1 Tax=Penaeus monodon TaxID=6687 RepID=UPI0018A7BB24|nr:pupal cuticle protein Edg-84A-like [Penaeus monodon]